MVMSPDAVKELFSIISKGLMSKLDYLEENNLLSLNNNYTYVGSGGYGFTNELPSSDFDTNVRCKDMWGFCESQETVGILFSLGQHTNNGRLSTRQIHIFYEG